VSDENAQITIAERYLTQPALDRHLPEHGRDARTALAIVESGMPLDGNPEKNLATFVTTCADR
jgi:glutamate decarboxylase